MPSLCQNPECYNTFSAVNYCFGFSASYFLEMVMPIR